MKAFIGRLNDIYVHRGIYFEFLLCENLSNAIQKYGSQDMYNNKIRECNYFYMLVGKNLGEYTYQEFEVVLSEFNKKNLPHIYVYFKHEGSDIKFSDSVLQFMETLDKKLKYYYGHFCELDSVKLNILLELINDPQIDGLVKINDGTVIVDNTPLLDLKDLPLYRDNKAISDLCERKQRLELEFAQLSVACKKNDAPELYAKWLKISAEKEMVLEKLHAYEKEFLSLLNTVSKLKKEGRVLSWREKSACDMIDKGDMDSAIVLLKDVSRENELDLAETIYENGRDRIVSFISENNLLINCIKVKGISQKKVPELVEYYEENLSLERKYHIDLMCYVDYILFLYSQNKYSLALRLCDELLQIYSIDETRNSVDVYTACGLINAKIHNEEKAGTFLRKAYMLSKDNFENDKNMLANCCNNLASLISESPEMAEEARNLYIEGISLIESDINLSQFEKGKKLLNIYINLGALLRAAHNEEAEKYYIKAIKLCTEWKEKEPAYFVPALCMALNNIGNYYCEREQWDKAARSFENAIPILRKLVSFNKSVFLPELARSYNNYGICLGNSNPSKAKMVLEKALNIRRKLSKEEPAAYLMDVAQSANNLAILLDCPCVDAKENEIEDLFAEALEIRESLNQDYYWSWVADIASIGVRPR